MRTKRWLCLLLVGVLCLGCGPLAAAGPLPKGLTEADYLNDFSGVIAADDAAAILQHTYRYSHQDDISWLAPRTRTADDAWDADMTPAVEEFAVPRRAEEIPAQAGDDALVAVGAQVYNNDGEVEGPYARAVPINIGDVEGYVGDEGMHGVLTFRGSGMRQNAAFGIASPTQMTLEKLWTSEAGVPSDGATAHGAQPLIVQWHKQIREMMALHDDKLQTASLKEVIFAGNNGTLYFYDLEDGLPTRDALEIMPLGPMLGTPSIYPRGFPLLAVGTGDPADASPEDYTGTVLCNLLQNHCFGILHDIMGHSFTGSEAVFTSPLFDNDTDTLLTMGESGLLYTMLLGTAMDGDTNPLSIDASKIDYLRPGTTGDDTRVDASMAAYGGYAYTSRRTAAR